MQIMEWYVPHMLAAYMDFGVGVLIAALMWTYIFRATPTFAALFAGGVLALLPDTDMLPPIFFGVYLAKDHHQLITHFPLAILPLAVLGGWFVAKGRGALLAGACVLWHLLHDSPEFGGGGIAWLWPYSREYFSLAGAKVAPPVAETTREIFFVVWSSSNAFSMREIAIGSVALMSASAIIGSSAYALFGSAIAACVWIATLNLWHINLLGGGAIAGP